MESGSPESKPKNRRKTFDYVIQTLFPIVLGAVLALAGSIATQLLTNSDNRASLLRDAYAEDLARLDSLDWEVRRSIKDILFILMQDPQLNENGMREVAKN